MKVNLEKTIVGAEEVEFLGFRISGLGIRRGPKKLAVLKRMKVLKTKKDRRSFIGSVTYLKEYIPYYAEILKPLTMMLPSKAKFVWSKEAETAAKQVVEVLELNTRLEHVREDKDLHLFTDASDVGIGGALLQFDRDDKDFERPGVITFMSKTLTSQEAGHTTTEKEAYA
ncbi:hypothetical protein ADUPG1_003042, partial [Aduncisulcus paluster]